ncbi:hypothetical protein LP422_00215 [Janibacter limosus]|uniref:Uncharacterized protein n=1 Tax=Janibacter limosus TaxID=53458 RepID=A0AC61U4G8_9MICO|nr:hypothetical protein [Janibacter limosus]UUZ44879.1 hypothetical protein LP422_00215 [Janibacter limosus]
MFQKNNKVEGGRVRAHETAESASLKVHEIIDKVAEQSEHGAERAQELKGSAADHAAAARVTATAGAADLREQAQEAKKQAAKDAKKGKKDARKQVRSVTTSARKQGKKAGKDAQDLRDTFVDDVLPKVVTTASGLAAAGAAASRKAADEATNRAPEVIAALRDDDRDPRAALAAVKGEKPKKKRGLKLLLPALVAGGIAAFVAKQKQGPKKDPWAVPAGDPYKAPTSGRESTVPASPAPAAAAGVAPAAEVAESADVTDPLAAAPVVDGESAEGTDARSSARDWADNSAVPSVSDTSEGADLSTDHLGGDLPVDGDSKA